MHKLPLFSLVIVLIAGITSCKTNIGPDTDNAAVLDSNKVDILTYASSKGLMGTMTSTGLYYVLNKPGSSTVTPAYGQELEFNYTLYLLNGPSNTTVISGVTDQLVDTTYRDSTVYYPFFAHSLKPGLEEGMLRMREGDQVTLLIPSALAFGDIATKTAPFIPANSPVRYDITLKRTRTEEQQINEYIARNKLTVTETTSSGLRFIKTVSVDSTGKFPTANQTLTLKYKGRLLRTAAFDSTGNGTYSTTLGKSAMAGFNEALAKLKVGEKATVIFPSALGYKQAGLLNSAGEYIIPPFAPLRFDIELIAAQ